MKRKIFGVFICLVLLAVSFFCAPGAKAADTYDIVRIKLSMGDITTTPVIIDGNYTIAEDETVVLQRVEYTVKIETPNPSEDPVLSLYNRDTLVFSGETITLIQHLESEGLNNLIYLDNYKHGTCGYLGDLHFTIAKVAQKDENGEVIGYKHFVQIVNHIYLDEYLYGVVPYEMSDSWPIEALKAQAISARTYSVRYMNSSGSYDMVDTPANQTYHGFNPEYENAIAAVNETAKQTLMSDGKFVQTYYAASNGGQIDIPQHIWSYSNTVEPYHVIKEDPFDIANPYSKEEMLSFPKAFSDTESVEYISDYYMNKEVKVDEQAAQGYAANALRYLKVSCLPSVEAAGYIAGVTGDVEVVGVNSIVPHTHEGNHGGVLNDDGSFAVDENGNVKFDGLDANETNDCWCFEKAKVNMTVLANKYVEGEIITLGDVNGDDKISIADYTMIRLDILELSELTPEQEKTADVNGDGKISIADYTMVRLHILELSQIEKQQQPGTLVQEEVTVEFDIDLHELDKSDGLYKSFFSSSLRLFAVEETDTSWNIYQRRFGHGIGMSQRGAQQMATTIKPETITTENPDGRVYNGTEILDFYYPNTTIYPLDIEKPVLTSIDTALTFEMTNATIINTDWLNVRITPDTSNAPIGRLPLGARIEVTKECAEPEWHEINYGGMAAYAHIDYIKLDTVE